MATTINRAAHQPRQNQRLLITWSFRGLALYGFEGHLVRGASGLAFPLREQRRVVLHDVLVAAHAEFPGCCVNPARFPFDLAEISDGSLIDNDLAFAIRPFGAELLIAE